MVRSDGEIRLSGNCFGSIQGTEKLLKTISSGKIFASEPRKRERHCVTHAEAGFSYNCKNSIGFRVVCKISKLGVRWGSLRVVT